MWDAGVDLSSSVSTFNKYEQKYEGNIGQYYIVFLKAYNYTKVTSPLINYHNFIHNLTSNFAWKILHEVTLCLYIFHSKTPDKMIYLEVPPFSFEISTQRFIFLTLPPPPHSSIVSTKISDTGAPMQKILST